MFSYALGVIVARTAPYEIANCDFSDAEFAHFVKGMCDAFPVDDTPESNAYANGLLQGATAMQELEIIKEIISNSNLTKEIDNNRFFDGIKAMVTGKEHEISLSQAYEIYHTALFREPSEVFVEKIKSRGGVETLESGVPVKIESMGSGEIPALADTIGYIYKASYINGNSFDSSRGEVVEAKVATLLPGLIDAVTALPVGTKCKVYLPWQKAYGEKGDGKVPPYSAIVYDLEIVKIVK
jgi:FKBP-type peptidyl-prolyl cis-trans isomerase